MSRILIVDDDEDISSSITLIMQMNGFDCQYVLNYKELFKKMEEVNPDLVIIDVKLKDIDGRQLCKEIKTDKKYTSLPVILISANSYISGNYSDYNANAFIPKPFESSSLINTVQKLMANKI